MCQVMEFNVSLCVFLGGGVHVRCQCACFWGAECTISMCRRAECKVSMCVSGGGVYGVNVCVRGGV